MGDRFIIKKRGCPYCNMAMKAVKRINLKLAPGKQIHIIDNYEKEEFGADMFPVIKKLERIGMDGYPFIYIDGVIIHPTDITSNYETAFTTLLEKDFII